MFSKWTSSILTFGSPRGYVGEEWKSLLISMSLSMNELALDQDARHANGVFPNAHDFLVVGGVFNNYIQESNEASDFRRIRLGDLVLAHEFRVDRRRDFRRTSIRRMYSAQIYGHSTTMTAAVYEGRDALEQWRVDIAILSRVRNPRFLQVYATADSNEFCATIFHDDLIHIDDVRELHHPSGIACVYLKSYIVCPCIYIDTSQLLCSSERGVCCNIFHSLRQSSSIYCYRRRMTTSIQSSGCRWYVSNKTCV
ncbi:hypothetical protein C8R43DRAFT_173249 [Mycena crocata]|nr:hypothetical protein C8R43DRAFT_173249 [Mycena crocata]